MTTQLVCPRKPTETAPTMPAPVKREECRSEILAEDLRRVAQAEREKRDLEQQRELARRQELARYD